MHEFYKHYHIYYKTYQNAFIVECADIINHLCNNSCVSQYFIPREFQRKIELFLKSI